MGQAKNWSVEDKQCLSDNWGTVSIPTLMKKLNRSENAIKIMAQRLGLGAFLDAGAYITFNQFLKALGIQEGYKYKLTSWVENRGFPLKTKKVNQSAFKVIYLEDWWEWAEKHQEFLNFSKFEENVLGEEPNWCKVKRRRDIEISRKYVVTPWTKTQDEKLIYLLKQYKYGYDDLSKKLGRTNGAIQRRICDLGLKERPIKAENHIIWAEDEEQTLNELIKQGCGYEWISEELCKSSKAIRGKVYRMYNTENLDKAREVCLKK